MNETKRAFPEAFSYFLFGNIPIVVKDALPDDVKLRQATAFIEKSLHPYKNFFANFVDIVYVGDFPVLSSRNLSALYHEGAILVKNEQNNTFEMADDIIHELAHVVHEVLSEKLSDSSLEDEYEGKLLQLFFRFDSSPSLKSKNLANLFFDPAKEIELDAFLYDKIGFDNLFSMSHDLFINPYAILSPKEYFATGFEELYLGNATLLKELCPVLYENLIYIEQLIADGEEK